MITIWNTVNLNRSIHFYVIIFNMHLKYKSRSITVMNKLKLKCTLDRRNMFPMKMTNSNEKAVHFDLMLWIRGPQNP